MAGLGEGLDVSDEMSESFVVSDCVAAVLTVTCRLLRLILPAVAIASFFFKEGLLLVVLLLLVFEVKNLARIGTRDLLSRLGAFGSRIVKVCTIT